MKSNNNYTLNVNDIRTQETGDSIKEEEILIYLNHSVSPGTNGWSFDSEHKVYSFTNPTTSKEEFYNQIDSIIYSRVNDTYNESHVSWNNMLYSLSDESEVLASYLNNNIESYEEDYTSYYLAISDIENSEELYMLMNVRLGTTNYNFVEEIVPINDTYTFAFITGPIVFIVISYLIFNRITLRSMFIDYKNSRADKL
ncbi:MAG: hypothetical protein ACTHVE_11145 [Senegalia sp. (in: firmicutes)]|uniref:hypothetical protein n=1 Tax=Senegalia sp. (in: firmicutes) TaxID=1924098 RepID=UPI003F9C8F0F